MKQKQNNNLKLAIGITNIICTCYFLKVLRLGNNKSLKNRIVKVTLCMEILLNVSVSILTTIFLKLVGRIPITYLGLYPLVPITLDTAICSLYYLKKMQDDFYQGVIKNMELKNKNGSIDKEVSSSLPFDENSLKYKCCCRRMHIRTAARLVSIALVLGIIINIFYSLGRTTTVMIYSWMLASFAVGVYGSLIYAVFKEKRIFTMPFLVFQAVFVIMTGVIFFVFMLCAMFDAQALTTLANDFGGIDAAHPKLDPNRSANASIRGFVVIMMLLWVVFICLQCWFFEIIYRFYQYLEDRETSFSFNMEPEFRVTG
uniref:Uncharacterized protein n=1 Tax=Ditylenchus dipsaci TaxID=166011 RepID=A0A915CQ07_9BILA